MLHTLSRHALERVNGRLTLYPVEVLRILNAGKYILLGEENKRIIHKLFYSKPDDDCFVAVCAKSDGTVITVLPSQYHKIWPLKYGTLRRAEEIVCGRVHKRDVSVNQPLSKKIGHDKIYVFFTSNNWNGKTKSIKAGSLEVSTFGDDLDLVSKNPTAKTRVARMLTKLFPGHEISQVTLRFGKGIKKSTMVL
ncbi:MAG: hypothetical protein V4690_00230 [Patescibacteria group bacterium]